MFRCSRLKFLIRAPTPLLLKSGEPQVTYGGPSGCGIGTQDRGGRKTQRETWLRQQQDYYDQQSENYYQEQAEAQAANNPAAVPHWMAGKEKGKGTTQQPPNRKQQRGAGFMIFAMMSVLAFLIKYFVDSQMAPIIPLEPEQVPVTGDDRVFGKDENEQVPKKYHS